jgi:hypothetical protein
MREILGCEVIILRNLCVKNPGESDGVRNPRTKASQPAYRFARRNKKNHPEENVIKGLKLQF